MPNIAILNQETIDKIAAGEVVERPCSVVKELVENAIDAGSTAITVEIKDGGISFIRITDNGCGIERDQVAVAFYRHSTSKIRSAEDLLTVKSLGFRGEALSSISAVARVELITKTYDELTGTRYVIEGSKELSNEEIGAPDGTTFIVKDLFYNVPARRKFLKTAQTEGSYISDMVEKLALSHPDISFKFINNNQTKLHTSGNGNRKDIIYHIFGREISSSLLEVKHECEYFKVEGFIGKPVITRGNRNYENYFINGRYVKSNILSRAIEEAYKSFLMQHQYPFTVLYFTFFSELDVNVHPTKMELRFDNNNEIYVELCDTIYAILSHKEMIPEVPVDSTPAPKKIVHEYKEPIPEPFEKRRINEVRAAESRSVYGQSVTSAATEPAAKAPAVNEQLTDNTSKLQTAKASASALVAGTGNSAELTPETSTAYEPAQVVTGTQQTLGDYDKVLLTESAKKQFSYTSPEVTIPKQRKRLPNGGGECRKDDVGKIDGKLHGIDGGKHVFDGDHGGAEAGADLGEVNGLDFLENGVDERDGWSQGGHKCTRERCFDSAPGVSKGVEPGSGLVNHVRHGSKGIACGLYGIWIGHQRKHRCAAAAKDGAGGGDLVFLAG